LSLIALDTLQVFSNAVLSCEKQLCLKESRK
jgi:hypothetical protein